MEPSSRRTPFTEEAEEEVVCDAAVSHSRPITFAMRSSPPASVTYTAIQELLGFKQQ